MKKSVLYCVVLCCVTIQAATVGRWKLDDYPVGTVLKVGDTFHDSVGGRDAVLCAVDPAQADTQYLPVVTNGFPAELAWEPKLWTTNSALLEMCDKAIWFKGGGLKVRSRPGNTFTNSKKEQTQ